VIEGSFLSATAASCTGGGLGGFCLGTVSLVEPAAPFKTEGCGRYHFLHGSTALGAFTGRWIGKFLAKFKLVVAGRTTIFVNRHALYSNLRDGSSFFVSCKYSNNYVAGLSIGRLTFAASLV